MALNIKHAETETMARKLAQRTGSTLTAAVRDALARRLDELSREKQDFQEDLQAFTDWQKSLGPRPPGPGFQETMDDMYDKHGLPR